jgi:hypothetical protein
MSRSTSRFPPDFARPVYSSHERANHPTESPFVGVNGRQSNLIRFQHRAGRLDVPKPQRSGKADFERLHTTSPCQLWLVFDKRQQRQAENGRLGW